NSVLTHKNKLNNGPPPVRIGRGSQNRKGSNGQNGPMKGLGLMEEKAARVHREQSRSPLKEIQAALAQVAPSYPFLWLNPGPVNPHVQMFGQYTGVSGKLPSFAWEPT